MPLDWACDANFSFDAEQHVCIKIEFRSPNIICDGHVEDHLCVHVVGLP